MITRSKDPKHPQSRTLRTVVGTSPNKHGLVFVQLSFDTRDPKELYLVTDTSVSPPEAWFEVVVGRRNKIIYVGDDYEKSKEVYKLGRRPRPGGWLKKDREALDGWTPRLVREQWFND